MNDDPLAYLAALQRFNRSWRWRRWKNPPRVLLWAVRGQVGRRWPNPVHRIPWLYGETIEMQGRGFYADQRDFRAALNQRSLKRLAQVIHCWVRGHDMPITDCHRCGAFIP